MSNQTKDQKKTHKESLYDELMGTGEPVKYKSVDIERSGTTIVIPEGMAYNDAREWIARKEQSEDQVINFQSKMKAYPYDGAYALYKAIVNLFGFADLATSGPSKDVPPEMINIKLPNGEYAKVPWGRIQFPGLDEECFVDTSFDSHSMEFIIKGDIKRKFEPIMLKLAEETNRILKSESIYKGRAIRVDLSFMDNGNYPDHPEFMASLDIDDDQIMLSDTVKLDYSSVLLRIERTKECYQNNIPLKHGCLLAGPYGTGKTLTAKWTAKKSVDNGWTFIYLENSKQLRNALRLAEMYTPAVIFAEDIDKAMEGGRSVKMNEILNTLDGIDTKDNPIITILTTNHVDKINKAFLRAGRIDSLIHMGPLDEKTAMQFINQFSVNGQGESILAEGDYTDAAKSLAGIVPAFASEVLSKAKMFSMYKTGTFDKITPADIEVAARSFKDHIELTKDKKVKSEEEMIGEYFIKIFGSPTDRDDYRNDVVDKIEDIKSSVDNI